MGLLAFVAPSSLAGLIASESFVYTPTGAQIVGQGTNAGWPTAGQLWTGATSAYVEKAELTYQNLTTSGDMLHVAANNQGVYRALGLTYSTAGNNYWFSALMEVDNLPGSSYAGISLFLQNDPVKTEKFFFGQTSGSKLWSMELSALTRRGQSSAASTAPAFVVLQLDGVNKVANLYVNPAALGGSAPVTPSATFSFTGYDFSFDQIRVQSGGTETYDVDEFRFGTTYASVTPVPEPATGLFLALTLGAAAMTRRRLTRRCARR
jgi:hypothetical protein